MNEILDNAWGLYSERHLIEFKNSTLKRMETCMKMFEVEFERLLNTSPE